MTRLEQLLFIGLCLSVIANNAWEFFLHRRLWRAINELRSQPKQKRLRYDSGERRILRVGASPDVATVDDSGERIRPGFPLKG